VASAIQSEWRNVALAPVILVFGPQEFFADRAIKSIRDKFAKTGNIDLVEIDASDYLEGAIFEQASAGLFGESKMIVFDGVERCSDALISDGIEYLNEPAEDSVVVFRHTGKSVRGKKLLETLRANGAVVEVLCNDFEKDWHRVSFVEAEFSTHGRKIQKQAASALAEIFGKDLEELAAACSQLQLDDAGEITVEIVEKYFGGRLETTSFKIADAALAGATGEALMLLRYALDQGLEPIVILGAFSKKIGEMARIIGNPKATAFSLGMPEWAFNKTRTAASGWTEDSIANLIHELAETDYRLKGGAKDPEYALERLVRLVANKGRKLG
jgi:DNA polymerase-3 subunit delta